ncbi:MAG: efflux RND transporter periplasmic adaptor subunit [Gammaproteobacteria bacterium]|nr:efflux RND transporter periplasmic adaptor subunit [Gammaproteobacteria bacterium]
MGLSWNADAREKKLDCVIEPHKVVEVSSAAAGVLASVLVDRDDPVKKGQLLARLQSGVEEAGVKLAEMRAKSKVTIQEKQARYELSKRSEARVGELFKKKMISDLERDEAKTKTVVAKYEVKKARMDHRIAQQELTRAREVLKRRSIVSKIDGIVVDKFKSAGEYVDEQPVLKLAVVDPLNVEVIAPVSLFGSIKKGMRAKVMPEAPVGGDYMAEVIIVDSLVDAASGTFGIRLRLPNRDHAIPAGLRCQVEFIDE